MTRTLPITLVILVAACSSTNFDELNHDSIGYIGDYSKFEEVQTTDGLKSFRYASDRIKSGAYTKILVEPVAFYPEEVASPQVPRTLLREIKAYIDTKLVEAVATYFEVVREPQVGGLTITPRITAIKTTTGDVRIREMVPIGSIVAVSRAAAGYRHQNVEIFMEIKATDSLDGEFVGGSVKQGKGAQVSSANEKVTLDSVRPLLDTWIQDAHEAFGKLKDFQKPKAE